MKQLDKTYKSAIMLPLLVLMLVAGVFVAQNAFAVINNDLPNSDFDAGGVNGAVDLHLKDLVVARVTKNKMAAYYPSSDTSANGKSIKITKGVAAQVCHIDTGELNGNVQVYIGIGGGVSRTYTININNVCGSSSQFYGETFNFPNGTLQNDPKSSYNKAVIEISYNVNKTLGETEGSDLNYHMELTGNNRNNGLLALTENNSSRDFGMRSAYTDAPPGNQNVKIAVPFGYSCAEPIAADSTREVKLYDADSGFGDTYMWIEKNGNKLDRGEYEDPVPSENIRRWIADEKRWLLDPSNLSENRLTMKESVVERGATYTLHVHNTGGNIDGRGGGYSDLSPHYNTLSVRIPQDSIYTTLDCSYSLRPAVNVNSDTYVYYPDMQVNAHINKTPSTAVIPEAHPWQLFAVRFANEPSTRNLTNAYLASSVNPCSSSVLPAGATSCGKIADASYTAQPSYAPSYTSGGPDAVGTRLCFFARIQNPTHLTTDDDLWSYSDLDCSISVKKPRTQFLGSDLRVAGNANSDTFSVNGKSYGSWVEYGMFTRGTNAMVPSGNSLRNGNSNPASAWNNLTFANTPSYGGYNPVPTASSAYTFFSNLAPTGSTLNQASPTSGVYDFGSDDMGTMTVGTNGTSIVVRKNGTLRITGDITVSNTGVTGAGNLSQVVLVADNIEIDPGVSRIDAWLITSPTGSIDTCNGAPITHLTVSDCPTTLEVNGALYTRSLKLRRTAGSNPTPIEQLRQPAERFNLRPDAQLWAYTYANKADYAQTDYIQELPPRY